MELECAPDGRRALLTGVVRYDLESVSSTRLNLLDLASGEMRACTNAEGARERLGRWSPDGSRVALLSDGGGGATRVRVLSLDRAAAPIEIPLERHGAEHIEWFPDGLRLLVLAAEDGASAGVLTGSGMVRAEPAAGPKESWRPQVHRGGEELGGWRRAFVVDLEAGGSRPVSPSGLNLWEACLAGERILAVTSPQPFEGAWARSSLRLIDPSDGSSLELYRPKYQLALPAAAPGGRRMAVIEGIASDRGLVAGDVIVVSEEGEARRLDVEGVDVTWIAFRDQQHLCFGGVRDTATVFGEVDLVSGQRVLHLESPGTTSDQFAPTAAVMSGGGLLLTWCHWDDAPQIGHALKGELRPLKRLANPGTDWLQSQLGSMAEVHWNAPDGLDLSGFVVTPRRGRPPYPTLLVIHGGPAFCWRPQWPGGSHLNLALFQAQGLALFLPNPRGSSGRGQDFLAMELGDYGGAEVQDVLSGLDHLVERGLSDPERLGVYGVSHGGYMSCWLTTRTTRFRAAVAGSPVTDWYSQHFGSNIPEFDEMYLRASPDEPGGAYFERSPVFFAQSSKTPTLLAAGLQDRCTPPGQAEEFHQALLAAGTPSDLVIYPEEGHGIHQLAAWIDFNSRVIAHLDRYLHLGRERGG